MRLICPNCGAQYAVDARAVPATGRDVLCSACGFTWFQAHPSQDEGLADELGHSQPAPEPDVAARSAFPHRTREDEDRPAALPASPPSARRPVDPGVMSVLRQEAEREQAARRAEQTALEVQGDLDLVPSPRAPDPPRASDPPPISVRRAMPADVSRSGRPDARALNDIGDAERAIRPAPRRDRLPDIEEITSTLQPSNRFAAEAPPAPEYHQVRAARVRRGQGQRIGFGLACSVFTLLAVLYLQGARIGAAVPAFEPGLLAYVTTVDSARVWIDDTLRRVAPRSTDNAAGLPAD